MSAKPTVLSTFSGMGGLDLGLERAGYDVLACVEADQVAQRTLKANRSDWPIFEPGLIEDFRDTASPADYKLRRGDLDLLAGAPPCQPYSKAAMWHAGSWNGFSDERAKPIETFFDLIEAWLPRAVLIENVAGFASGAHSVLDLLQERLNSVNATASTDYRLQWRLLDSADFGVAQHRKRAIVVAFRDGHEFAWPSPTHHHNPVSAWEAIADLPEPDGLPVATGKWAALLPSIPEGQNYLFHTSRGGGKPLFGYRTRYWSFLLKLSKRRPSWTLPAQPGPSTGPFHWDSRPLTTNELLRLQSFPLDWEVVGMRRDRIKQIGNATPPLLAEVLGRSIRTTVDGVGWKGKPTLTIDRRPVIPRARARKSLAPEFVELIGERDDHPGAGLGPKPRSS